MKNKFCSMIFLCFVVIFAGAALAAQGAASSLSGSILSGSIVLWDRAPCSPGNSEGDCQLPQRLEAPRMVQLSLVEPAERGTVTRQRQVIRFRGYTVWLTFYWTFPRQGPAYVVTQTLLFDREMKSVAECNRYDFFRDIEPFPVGICSGFIERRQIGVSLARVLPSAQMGESVASQ